MPFSKQEIAEEYEYASASVAQRFRIERAVTVMDHRQDAPKQFTVPLADLLIWKLHRGEMRAESVLPLTT